MVCLFHHSSKTDIRPPKSYYFCASKILHMRPFTYLFLLSLLFFTACSENDSKDAQKKSDEPVTEQPPTTDQAPQEVKDPHSFGNIHEVYCEHLDLTMDVDFDTKTITGIAQYDININEEVDTMVFDTRKITIDSIVLGNGESTGFRLGEYDELLGTPLYVEISPETEQLSIHYKTSPESDALQWLSPEQTAGKEHPYLFTQGQAILTRTWIPCQDSPLRRITYDAHVTVPSDLMAVMSASNPTAKSDDGTYDFSMEQPIPIYLMALAVGDLAFEPIGERTGVYSEPSMIDAAANEMADMEKMLVAAEKLYGEYLWDRYDVIVLPPSFPFGGMENPRLTFATPTIIAGDRSLVSLIAHELAHSWSGNLVTNATWNDFWLNEGFTVYFENRIMEELYGKDYADMLMLLNEQGLRSEIAEMNKEGKKQDTYLKLRLAERNPDEAMTAITYDKGAFFLRMLEDKAGRERFDAFLSSYFQDKRFTNVTTEDFLAYLDENLIKKHDLDVNVDEWVYGPGLPDSHVPIESDRFNKVDAAIASFYEGTPAKDIVNPEWSTHEILHFIGNIKEETTVEQMAELNKAFGFCASGNSEIFAAWAVKAIQRGYNDCRPEIRTFLTNVGRRKFLTPIYKALASTEEGKAFAMDVYSNARQNYHSVSTGTIDDILGYKG